MQRKRAKLQVQNSEMVASPKTQIFRGVRVYVNGWVEPPQHELRALLVENGGIFEPYLDKKSLVTHIVTCNLTEAKLREFKNMNVVFPEWLTESVKAGTLLPWRDFKYVQGGGPPGTQGALRQPPQIPRYAADASNLNAQRVMADPEWRSANTSAKPGYVKNYHENSRLHVLSTTKTALKQLVREAQEQMEQRQLTEGTARIADSPVSPWKGKERAGEERVIMHCDFDCFFVSVGLLGRPELRGKPVVVCHSQGTQGGNSSTSEIACASYEARAHGIKNGMSLQQARGLYPMVLTMPYEFERYKEIAFKFYTVLMSHADDVEAVSIDEALIDVTTAVNRLRSAAARAGSPHDPAKDFAEQVRAEVKEATGCELSIGISHNILLARLATRRAKPAGSLHLVPADVPGLIETLDITDLRGFGSSTRDKTLTKFGSTALKDLAKKSSAALSDALGKKTGETLYNAIRGIDDTKLSSDKQPKSVSAEVNYGIRFESNDDAEKFIFELASEVENRLNAIKMLGRSITLKVMKRDPSAPVEPPKFMGHGLCDDFNKTTPLAGPGGRATSNGKVLGEHAWRSLKSFNFDPKELRGIGIQIHKLEPASGPVQTHSNQQTLGFQPAEAQIRRPPAAPPPPAPLVPAVSVSAVPSTEFELPNREEVDEDVFNGLPASMQLELKNEWQRRSESPFVGKPAPAQPVSGPSRARSTTPYPQRGPAQPARVQAATRRTTPQKGPFAISKKSLLERRIPNKLLRPTDDDLRAQGFAPEVFRELPKRFQIEALATKRMEENGVPIPQEDPERRTLKPRKYEPPPDLFRQPPPYAKYPEPVRLAQRVRKGEHRFFTETDDVQDLIEGWVDAYREFIPEQKDIDFVVRFLTRSVDSERSSDTGVERAVATVKWWLLLLRRYWGDYEHLEGGMEEDGDEDGLVANAWWKTFREVKEQIDIVARKKFGGRLSIR